jgi:hypothetical protein
VYVALTPENVDADVLTLTYEKQVQRVACYIEVVNAQFGQR